MSDAADWSVVSVNGAPPVEFEYLKSDEVADFLSGPVVADEQGVLLGPVGRQWPAGAQPLDSERDGLFAAQDGGDDLPGGGKTEEAADLGGRSSQEKR